jgi:hypothetical protein
VDFAQTALLFVGWIVAFMLGKELQVGFAQWQEARRRRSVPERVQTLTHRAGLPAPRSLMGVRSRETRAFSSLAPSGCYG